MESDRITWHSIHFAVITRADRHCSQWMRSGRNKKKERRGSGRESGERDAGKDREKEKEKKRGSNLRGSENEHLLLIL